MGVRFLEFKHYSLPFMINFSLFVENFFTFRGGPQALCPLNIPMLYCTTVRPERFMSRALQISVFDCILQLHTYCHVFICISVFHSQCVYKVLYTVLCCCVYLVAVKRCAEWLCETSTRWRHNMATRWDTGCYVIIVFNVRQYCRQLCYCCSKNSYSTPVCTRWYFVDRTLFRMRSFL